MLTHLLDTSAWLAHLRNEPGGDRVTALFENTDTKVGVSVLSLVEVHGQLKAIGRETEWANMMELYQTLFDQIVHVDASVALRAISLRQSIASRLPGIDSIIAATASLYGAILVHRDAHFLSIPDDLLQQEVVGSEG